MSPITGPRIFCIEAVAAALKAAGVAIWSWNVETDVITMDERGFNIWGVSKTEEATFSGLSRFIHPEDLDRVRAGFTTSRSLIGPYETDFRILFENEIRWIAARGQGSDADIVDQLMFGIFIDVTERKQSEEANELLADEMSHRVNNLLMVAAGLARSVGRSADNVEDMVRDLTDRLLALGRAHVLARFDPEQRSNQALLGDLLGVLLSPYDNLPVPILGQNGPTSGRIHISVPKIGIGAKAVSTLALVFHELATNSLKYGALSSPMGEIDVSAAPYVSDEIVLVWTEQGGPPLSASQAVTGFGSTLLKSVSDALGGSIELAWIARGLSVTLRMNTARLGR